MKILNKTARVIFAGRHMLVPARPCEVGDVEELAKKVPRMAELLASGEIEKISEAVAKKVEQDFEKENLATLKKAAKERGLDTSKAKTKQDYIALLKG